MGRNDAVLAFSSGLSGRMGSVETLSSPAAAILPLFRASDRILLCHQTAPGGIEEDDAVFHFGNGCLVDHSRVFRKEGGSEGQ